MEENEVYFSDISVNGYARESCGFITIMLKGDIIYSHDGKKIIHNSKKQSIYFGFMQEFQEIKKLAKKNVFMSSLTFAFSKGVLLEYLKEFKNAELISKLEKIKTFKIFKTLPISSKNSYIITNLFNNPYRGILKYTYFENNATQLLINILEDLSQSKTEDIFLSDIDKDRLHTAKTLLLEDLQNPPNIRELAHLVAINEDKLKKGFKLMYNNTIFKTLTDQRMKQALIHVETNEMTVGEIAYEAGYENVSSFIATFKKTYGQTPGTLQRKNRKKTIYY